MWPATTIIALMFKALVSLDNTTLSLTYDLWLSIIVYDLYTVDIKISILPFAHVLYALKSIQSHAIFVYTQQ